MSYECKKCGAKVTVTPTAITRSCDCAATVIASMSGSVIGHGGMQETLADRLFAAFRNIGAKLMQGSSGGRV